MKKHSVGDQMSSLVIGVQNLRTLTCFLHVGSLDRFCILVLGCFMVQGRTFCYGRRSKCQFGSPEVKKQKSPRTPKKSLTFSMASNCKAFWPSVFVINLHNHIQGQYFKLCPSLLFHFDQQSAMTTESDHVWKIEVSIMNFWKSNFFMIGNEFA